MPFTAHDLRYKTEQSYPLLYAYLHRHAQRFLGALRYDAFEVDLVVGHVVEQLTRLGILGAGDSTPLTALDHLTDAQFYAFLSRSVRNKSIDRLRKHRFQMHTATELDSPAGGEGDGDSLLNESVESLWGTTPFSTPEEITLRLASQYELRDLLKHCIMALSNAPFQLQAVIEEMEGMGADHLLRSVIDDLKLNVPVPTATSSHMSQHKDHAHRKLRHCLQQNSSNLTVMMALRLSNYGTRNADTHEITLDIHTLAQDDLSEADVRTGLQELVAEGLLEWHGEEVVRLSTAQVKRLARFYREDE
jgi:hypothetical protein